MSKIKISPLQQALLESEEVLKAAEKNAKDILYSQMRPDLEKTIRESLAADEDDDNAYDNTTDNKIEPIVADLGSEDSEDITSNNDTPDFSGDDKEITIEPEKDEKPSFDSDDDEVDLTGASDEDVISVFKKLGDDAEIEVVKDGNNININANGEEFIIRLNEEKDGLPNSKVSTYKEPKTVKVKGSIAEEELTNEEKDGLPNSKVSTYKEPKTVKVPGSILEDEKEEDKYSFMDEDEYKKDEVVFEIEMPSNDEQSIDEVARTHADGRKMERKPEGFFKYAASRVRTSERDSINESVSNEKVLLKEAEEIAVKLINENKVLIEDLNQHKETLRKLREAIESISIFNTNLANVNKLFCLHATTLDEKHEIIKRFQGIGTVNESKTLYKTISTELKSKNIITETVESVINNKVSGTTGEQLLESNKHAAGLSRIQELMNYKSKE